MATKKTPAKTPVTNPFAKAKKSSDGAKGKLDHVNPEDPIVKAAVDQYKHLAAEIKRLEGEQSAHKAVLSTYGRQIFAERQTKEISGNFHIQGEAESVTYIYQNSNSALGEEAYAAFVASHGEEAAETLLALDAASVRFNAEVLTEDGVMEKVVNALQVLPKELLDRLFTGAGYAVKDEVFIKAREFAKTPAEYQAIMNDLRVKNYVKA